ncbi:VOC family protein [Tamaricihabitans halophyticus]|uniref:VOC family protein n=1 Tax=Tamaricihabitans halophyticus TaxID=1262583 RepID=UPI001045B9C9
MALPKLDVIAVDCPAPWELADFYAKLLGWESAITAGSDDEWVQLANPDGGMDLAFQYAADYQPPTWPAGPRPQMLHLDFAVRDLDAAQQHAVAVGAKPVDGPVESPTFRVFLDPAGHPFCLCAC